jgi:hypothetical protein
VKWDAQLVRRRELLALSGLVAVAACFAIVAHRFASRGVLAGGLIASLLALAVGLYVVFRAWPNLPRSDVGHQLTRHGALYILTIFAVAAIALSSANNLLFLVLACMLAALLASGLFSRLNLAELELQCLAPDNVFAGQEVPVRVLLRNLKSWMSSFSIWLGMDLPGSRGVVFPEIYFPMVAGGQTASTMVSVRFPRRGRYQQDRFWLRSGFPFGLLVKTVRLRLPKEILVYPALVDARELENTLPRSISQWERRLTGPGQDLYRIRPYQTGDSSRVVHWKASAHTGDLKVREFTLEEDRRVEILFDTWLPEGEEWRSRFERAVEQCASIVWRLHEIGAGLKFQPGGLENVYDVLRYLAVVEPAAGGEHLPIGPSGLFQVIFTAKAENVPASLPESGYCCYALEDL